MANELRKKIAFAGPWITEREVESVIDGVRHGFYETFHQHADKLEAEVCRYVGRKYAFSTHCCTLALHLACAALGLKPGDEVICTDFSWVATAYAIIYTGATPVFVDIDPDTWCIDPQAIREAINEKTKAIMLVHTFGHPAQMDAIMEIARSYNLKVIEDAAPALGAEFHGRKAGSFGDIGCFSFHGAKIAVSGEGGIFLTDDEDLYRRAALLGSMGRTDSGGVFWSDVIGFQYSMANLTAALAFAQVQRIEELVERKRAIFSWYDKRLGDVPGVKLIREKPGCRSNYCYPSLLLEESVRANRDNVIAGLRQLNVHCRPGFPPMSLFPAHQRRYDNPVTQTVFRRGICLPAALNLEEEDIEFVCTHFLSLIRT